MRVGLAGVYIVAVSVAFIPVALGQKVRGDIELSQYDRKFDEARNQVFSEWMPEKEAFDVLAGAEIRRDLVLLAERDSKDRFRFIIVKAPKGVSTDISCETDVDGDKLVLLHKTWVNQGYRILTIRENPRRSTYSAIWVPGQVYGYAVQRLSEIGVSPASVELQPPSSEPVDLSGVTAPMREWKDEQGRAIEASVEGVDDGFVDFKRKDGRRFKYPLEKLSSADRSFLTNLARMPDPEPDLTAGGKPEFSEWLTRDEFEIKWTEERGKGLYAIYIESNRKEEVRALFVEKPVVMGVYIFWLYDEAGIRDRNRVYQSQGYTLLSLSYDRSSQTYNGTWVSDKDIGRARNQLKSLGITPASIGDEIVVSEVQD